MFNKTKFKKGDIVLTIGDLTNEYEVKNVYWDGIFKNHEKVVLENGLVFDENQLTFYSKPLKKLAIDNKKLVKEINDIKSLVGNLSKELHDKFNTLNSKHTELNNKVIKRDTGGLFETWTASYLGMLGVNYKPEPKTLEERIEALESKQPKKKEIKVKKTKKVSKSKK